MKKIVHCSIEKIVKKIVHCSIEKIVKKIVQDGKSALVTQGGLHVLITDTAVLLPVSSSEYNSILSMVGVRAEIKKDNMHYLYTDNCLRLKLCIS